MWKRRLLTWLCRRARIHSYTWLPYFTLRAITMGTAHIHWKHHIIDKREMEGCHQWQYRSLRNGRYQTKREIRRQIFTPGADRPNTAPNLDQEAINLVKFHRRGFRLQGNQILDKIYINNSFAGQVHSMASTSKHHGASLIFTEKPPDLFLLCLRWRPTTQATSSLLSTNKAKTEPAIVSALIGKQRGK